MNIDERSLVTNVSKSNLQFKFYIPGKEIIFDDGESFISPATLINFAANFHVMDLDDEAGIFACEIIQVGGEKLAFQKFFRTLLENRIALNRQQQNEFVVLEENIGMI